MINVQRATVHGAEAVDAVPPAITSFPLQTSDFWVNALWFMSLGLSLSTTLLAVLAKQWIHQYISVASAGSPRNRCRVRHFRYRALKKWHVPLIIDLLPVLMHAALGLFFTGLVIFLWSLSNVMAAHMAIIAIAAFGVYSITNVLPVFYPDCAYKTPLSVHSFHAFFVIRRRVANLLGLERAQTSILPTSLPDIELEMVERQADVLDVSSLGWLFNLTSNLSVQSIVLQSFSSLPLPSIPLVSQAGPEGITSIIKAINDHFHPNQTVDRFERFERAALRFENQECDVVLSTSSKERSNYTRFSDPVDAMELIKGNLIGYVPHQTRLDALLWGKVFSTALNLGIRWLEIDHDRPSRVWSELLRCVVARHDCDNSNCDGIKQPLLTFHLRDSMPPLFVDSYEAEVEGCELWSALSLRMLPSFLKWLLHVGFPDATRSEDQHTQNLPDDIFLFLCMLQTPSIQKTSSLHMTWVGNNPMLCKDFPSLFRNLLDTVCEYTTDEPRQHLDASMATIKALQSVMRSEAFGTGTVMTLEDEAIIVLSVFKGLNWSLHCCGSFLHDFTWLSSQVMRKVLHVIFEGPQEMVTPRLGNVLSYLLCSPDRHTRAIEAVYAGLLERHWLSGLAVNLHTWSIRKSSDAAPLYSWRTLDTGYLAACYIDGMAVLASQSSGLYGRVVDDLENPTSLSTLCKILLLSDVDVQAKLWRLAKMVRIDNCCLEDLVSFSTSRQAIDMYSSHYYTPHVGIGGRQIQNLSPGTFHIVATALKQDVEGGENTPSSPSYLPNDLRVSWNFRRPPIVLKPFQDARADFNA